MMMQIVRRESAVAQGLRSDTFQATKKAESASMRTPTPSHSLWPVGCGPLPTHNQPRSQEPLKSQTQLAVEILPLSIHHGSFGIKRPCIFGPCQEFTQPPTRLAC